ncbi:hypothetical protein CSV75_14765 [Sporosarcina sp. P18a]|uniref:DUF4238 domain-containing protein n=1 Tax=Sporosarcina sp. P18a TaxID=2048259 RepID=UPI000C16B0FB|nr:DUF4238 domain-containing protein [Sporosarcina sp. P18a]PIC78746.1 hypothetical protein CSV75_14765 [Sporosarcina sp. P18a]
MSKVINQHYVPRSYLMYFANKKGSEYEINVYDKETNRSFPCNIKGVASSRYFYDFPTIDDMKNDLEKKGETEAISNLDQIEEIEIQAVEKFFSDIEGDFKNKLNHIRTRYTMTPNPLERNEVITESEKEALAINLAYQLVRTRDFRENFNESTDKFLQHIVDRMVKKEFPEMKPGSVKVIRDKKYDGLQHASFLFNKDFLEFPMILLNHIWTIGINETGMSFYTSDNPVVKYGHKKDAFFSNAGIASPGIEIAFPISEKLILILRDKSYFGVDAELLYGNKFIRMEEENVIFYNSLQVTQSNRQIYSSNPDFELINKMKEDNPGALIRKSKIDVIAGGKKL